MNNVPRWMQIAESYLGIKEGPGAANNPRVVELYRLAGFPEVKHDSVPWCAAFVGGVLALAGHKGSGSLAARSYEQWGRKLERPVYGCVGVKKRRGGAAWMGHVGFVVGASKTEIILLGGNQNDGVNIAAFLRSEFTAYRWVPGVLLPVPALPLPTTVAGAVKEAREA